MASNLIERTLAAYLYNVHERDWMDLAQCEVLDPSDTSFIAKPTPELEERWAAVCASCPVFTQCHRWAEREQITGVYAAGEFRE